ncbi:MAG: VPLPA-CTERM sorting domain-containing protein [Phycisphaerales bacterium]
MITRIGFGIATVLVAGTAASAIPVLQMDLNSFAAQATSNTGNPAVNSPFGGTSHTGAVRFSKGSNGILAGIFVQNVVNGPFTSANFTGNLTAFSGQVNLSNGQVTGGSVTITINTGDTYTCNIKPNSGAVSTFVGGGFKIEAITQNGFFSDNQYGNVNVAPWFNNQGATGLGGSFLQFNFNPNAAGLATSDMDLFVDANPIPLPAAAWMGMATLGGIVAVRRFRR